MNHVLEKQLYMFIAKNDTENDQNKRNINRAQQK
jgi:hypothetical protein